MLTKVLIANRGEIALRILRACKECGIKTVAVYSNADMDLIHVKLADESVCIGGEKAIDSYLNISSIISAAKVTNSDAIHPGYGFLAENVEFAEQVEKSGFVFIGPEPQTIRSMGDKISAINVMRELGVPCMPGSNGPIGYDNKEIERLAKKIGYPVIIKSTGGSGGRGMRVVCSEAELSSTVSMMRSESFAAFGNDVIYLEKFLETSRHIEIQVLCDGHGNAIHLGERDCSMQCRYQKIIEEASAPSITGKQRQKIGQLCIDACLKMNYRGAGTFEFLYNKGEFYFIGMNARIQVEHPITEVITGVDIVKEQLMIASGKLLKIKQEDVKFKGHAIECRINAEDPQTLIPSHGMIHFYHPPGGFGVRVDSHIYSGYTALSSYDSMIGKVIVFGETREIAIARMNRALDELVIDGIKTNITLHQKILNDQVFLNGGANIHYLEKLLKIYAQ